MKIGPVVSTENILIEIALRVHVVVRRICRPISLDVLDRFLQSFHHMKVLCMPIIDLYLILQFIKGVAMATKSFCCNEGKLILRAFFAVRLMEHGFVSLLLARGTLWRRAGY